MPETIISVAPYKHFYSGAQVEIGEARKEIGGGFDACPEFCVSWIVRIDCVSGRSLDATDIDGRQVSLDQYKGKALLIIRWWGIPGTTILASRGIRSWNQHNAQCQDK